MAWAYSTSETDCSEHAGSEAKWQEPWKDRTFVTPFLPGQSVSEGSAQVQKYMPPAFCDSSVHILFYIVPH